MATGSPVGIVGLLDTSRTKTKSPGQSIYRTLHVSAIVSFIVMKTFVHKYQSSRPIPTLIYSMRVKANRFSEVVSVNNLPPKNKKPG